jgi:hypothetical protein
MTWLLSLITGPLLGKVLEFFQKKADNELAKYQTGVQADTQVILAQVNAQIETQKQLTLMVQSDKGWWVTAYMKPTAFYVSLAHYAAVVGDSLPWFGHKVGSWGIPELPGQYATMQNSIILACVGIAGLQTAARIFRK